MAGGEVAALALAALLESEKKVIILKNGGINYFFNNFPRRGESREWGQN